VCVWDVETLECLATVGHNGIVLALAEASGKIFSGSDDATITVWDSSSLKCLGTLNGHRGAVVALAAGERHLFSGSRDKAIRCASAYKNTNSQKSPPSAPSSPTGQGTALISVCVAPPLEPSSPVQYVHAVYWPEGSQALSSPMENLRGSCPCWHALEAWHLQFD
jgi:WD40 repeat protein